jgi:hypothetical protein
MSIAHQPPILNSGPPLGRQPPNNSFARQAAKFSVVAPLVAVAINMFVQPQVRGNRIAMIILGLISVSLIVSGCTFGIVALVVAKRRGEKGISGTAAVGTIICGILTLAMLLSIPALWRAMERAKETQRQRIEQKQ